MELERTEDIVLKVLQKYEQTRSDDFVLVYAVYREINFNVATIDRFSEVMLNHKKYGFPSLFHITRQIIYFPNKIFNLFLLLLLSYFLLSVKIIQHRRIILRNACLLLLTGLTSSLLGLLLGYRSRVIRIGTTILILAFVVSNSASCITVIIHNSLQSPQDRL